mmetsp:Transcript_55247/g.87738  ORF Transcript_55247/g.87738 Transcript_55247/m.87738 type:complete len:99 (-) Transcript_55247:46-342(-)
MAWKLPKQLLRRRLAHRSFSRQRVAEHALKLDGVRSLRWANGDTAQLFGVRFSLTYRRRKRFKDWRFQLLYWRGSRMHNIHWKARRYYMISFQEPSSA